MTSLPTDQSDDITDNNGGCVVTSVGGVTKDEPDIQLRQRPQKQQISSVPQREMTSSVPQRETTSSDPPGGFSLFLIVLLLICIFILVARRLVIMFITDS